MNLDERQEIVYTFFGGKWESVAETPGGHLSIVNESFTSKKDCILFNVKYNLVRRKAGDSCYYRAVPSIAKKNPDFKLDYLDINSRHLNELVSKLERAGYLIVMNEENVSIRRKNSPIIMVTVKRGKWQRAIFDAIYNFVVFCQKKKIKLRYTGKIK